MLNWYSVRMRNAEDECWTMQEASSERGACNITQMKWGKPWRAVEAKQIPEFYHVGETATAEELKVLNEQRKETLIRANCKAIVTPAGEFVSMKAALAHFKTRAKLKKLMEENPGQYYFKQ